MALHSSVKVDLTLQHKTADLVEERIDIATHTGRKTGESLIGCE